MYNFTWIINTCLWIDAQTISGDKYDEQKHNIILWHHNILMVSISDHDFFLCFATTFLHITG